MATPGDIDTAASALAALTERVLLEASERLQYRLKLAHRRFEPPVQLDAAVPVLSLHLRLNDQQEGDTAEYGISSERLPPALRAFAALAVHSRRLAAFPDLQAAFWTQLGASYVLVNSTWGIHMKMLTKADSPAFELHFGSERAPGSITDALVDALLELFVAPLPHEAQATAPGIEQRRKVALGLSFAHCRLDTVSLQRVQNLLDRLAASPARHFDISALDLSDTAMGPAELDIVAEITQKCSSVYQVRELKLNNVIPVGESKSWRIPTWKAPTETPEPLLRIVQSVLNVERVTHLSTSQPTALTLQAVSLSGNRACPLYFAALGSALRYGSPVEELFSSFAALKDGRSKYMRECWRWLAFGLFYPRPKRFERACKLRSLGTLAIDTADALATYAKTLRDPVSELLYDGRRTSPSPSRRDLMVCVLKSGAKVEIAQRERSQVSQIRTFDSRVELEALAENDDGSVCVVVPGVGLAWAQRADVEKIERESSDGQKQRYGKYDVSLGLPTSSSDKSDFATVLQVVGPQLQALSISSNAYQAGSLRQILAACNNLERLNLCDYPKPGDIDALAAALGSHLGRRLVMLALSAHSVEDDVFEKLAPVLSDPASVPRLLEFRVRAWMSKGGVSNMMNILRANPTIRVVEMCDSSMTERMAACRSVQMREQIEREFDGKLLSPRTPLSSKLAFLSVVRPRSSSTSSLGSVADSHSARESLDQWLVTHILQFAQSEQVHRNIIWTNRPI